MNDNCRYNRHTSLNISGYSFKKGTSRILTIERSRKESVRCLHSMAFAHGLVPPFFSLFVKYPLPCTKH